MRGVNTHGWLSILAGLLLLACVVVLVGSEPSSQQKKSHSKSQKGSKKHGLPVTFSKKSIFIKVKKGDRRHKGIHSSEVGSQNLTVTDTNSTIAGNSSSVAGKNLTVTETHRPAGRRETINVPEALTALDQYGRTSAYPYPVVSPSPVLLSRPIVQPHRHRKAHRVVKYAYKQIHSLQPGGVLSHEYNKVVHVAGNHNAMMGVDDTLPLEDNVVHDDLGNAGGYLAGPHQSYAAGGYLAAPQHSYASSVQYVESNAVHGAPSRVVPNYVAPGAVPWTAYSHHYVTNPIPHPLVAPPYAAYAGGVNPHYPSVPRHAKFVGKFGTLAVPTTLDAYNYQLYPLPRPYYHQRVYQGVPYAASVQPDITSSHHRTNVDINNIVAPAIQAEHPTALEATAIEEALHTNAVAASPEPVSLPGVQIPPVQMSPLYPEADENSDDSQFKNLEDDDNNLEVSGDSVLHSSYHIERAKCNPNPCKNGGACTALQHGYDCACRVGYKGLHCEQRNRCQPNPCVNGGNCYELSSGFKCMCHKGYRGDVCQERHM